MSERELNRIEVLSQVTQGRMTVLTSANLLGLGRRQAHKLLKDFQNDGQATIRHTARSPIHTRIDPAVRQSAVTLVRKNDIKFGPTFAAETLVEDNLLKASRGSLRKCPLGRLLCNPFTAICLSGNRRRDEYADAAARVIQKCHSVVHVRDKQPDKG